MPEVAADGAQDARRQAWLRAAAGLGLIAVLLAALALFERQFVAPGDDAARGLPPPPAAAAEPAAARPAPLVGEVVALPAPEPAPDAAPDAAPDTQAAATPELSAAPEIAPPGAREADAPPPDLPPVAAGGGSRLVLQSAAEEPDATAVAARPAAAPKAASAKPGKGFLLQLGVFGETGNAQALYEELRRQGLPARLETRVVAGPFDSRDSAAAARDRLARAGMARGLVVRER